jgi:hypothetical protein
VAVVFFEHVTLLECVVDRCLVVRAKLLQHVIEYAGALRGRSRIPSSWVNNVTRELRTTLGEAPYEVPKRLAGLLGACVQVPGVPRAHACALEVPHEGADQVIPVVDLTSWQVLEPHPGGVSEVQRQVADNDLVGGGSTQLARLAIVVEPYTGVRLPCVLVDRRGLVEALREARRADLPAEHAGPRGLRGR